MIFFLFLYWFQIFKDQFGVFCPSLQQLSLLKSKHSSWSYVFNKLTCIFSYLISQKKNNLLDEFLGINTLHCGYSKLWHTNQVHMGAPIKREFLLLYLIIKMSSIFRPQLFPDAFPVKGRQNSVKILHRSQSSLPLISFSSGRGLYFRFTLKVLPKFLSN